MDIAVLEVGLGGRLDSTNVVIPQVSVITNIGLDHTAILGNTLSRIAYEKAGIIKQGVPVVSAVESPEALSVIEKNMQGKSRQIVFAWEGCLDFGMRNAECGFITQSPSSKSEIRNPKSEIQSSRPAIRNPQSAIRKGFVMQNKDLAAYLPGNLSAAHWRSPGEKIAPWRWAH